MMLLPDSYFMSPLSFIENPNIWLGTCSRVKAQGTPTAFPRTRTHNCARCECFDTLFVVNCGCEWWCASSVAASPNFGLSLSTAKYSLAMLDKFSGGAGKFELSHMLSISIAAEPIQKQTLQDFHAAFGKHGLQELALCPAYG